MYITYFGITISYLCSIIYHIFNIGSSFHDSCLLSSVDYFGIISHLIGCMITLVYYAYYHELLVKLIYVTIFTTIGIACMIMNYYQMFTTIANTKMNSFKRTLFFSFIVVISLPSQLKVCSNISEPDAEIIKNVIFTDIAYLSAALIYSCKYPEKWFPGYCDLFNSHALFHIIIIIAGLGSIRSLSLISYHQIHVVSFQTLEE